MLHIRTFGGLSISRGEGMHVVVSRSTKMWGLLECLLAFYPNPVTADKLVEILWPGGAADPAKNIRDIVYRLRKTLAQYGGGLDYILSANGCYAWNTGAAYFIDCVEFNRHMDAAEDTGNSTEERIAAYNTAISLYRGEFLGEKWSAMETWASNFVGFYRRLFLHAVDELSRLYEKRLDYSDIILLYNKAILVEPYEEALYTRQIQVLIKNGEYALAKHQYRQIEKLFLKEFSTAPSQTLQNLYAEAAKSDTRKPMDLRKIKEQFDETAGRGGPILCAPDTFGQIYRYGKGADERITLPVFLGKMTLMSEGDRDYSKPEFERAMAALQYILLGNLRKGDIVCRYSPNQFLLLLTTKNTANIREGLKRIDGLFDKELEWSNISLEMELMPIRDAE